MKQIFKDNKKEILYDLKQLIERLELVDHTSSNWFLCNMTKGYTLEYIKSQRPNGRCNKEFTKHRRYTGEYVWWEYWIEEIDGDMCTDAAKRANIPEVMKEKIRFVNYIITKLEKA